MKTWIIDSGHGGFINGEYVTAPDKMFQHHTGEIFYEGVFNRKVKDMLISKLWILGINCIDLCPTELDVPLSVRVKIANDYHSYYKNCVLISLHSNAGGGTGFEIYTSHGETASDPYAEMLGEKLMSDFPSIKMRKSAVAGKIGKEAHFYILKYTDCPAILPECLFFDNYQDYLKLINNDFVERYIQTIVRFIKKAELVSV